MAEFQSVFERVERKYLLAYDQYEALKEDLLPYLTEDPYGPTTVMNLYFDTPDFRVIRDSLEHPKFKEKLRIRSYGVPTENGTAFLELKKKLDGVVYKRRIALPYGDIRAHFTENEPLPKSQIAREILYYERKIPELRPSMTVIYERSGYFGADDPDFRITFDEHVRYRDVGIDLMEGKSGTHFMDDDHLIMEVKIHGAMPYEVARLFSEHAVYPHTYSKYGQAYRHRYEGNMTGWRSKISRRKKA